jgi:hypothetical protein
MKTAAESDKGFHRMSEIVMVVGLVMLALAILIEEGL